MKINTTRKYIKQLVILVIVTTLAACSTGQQQEETREDVPVIPYPSKVLKRSGYVKLDNNFWVIANVSDTAMARLGKYLVDEIDQIPGALASIADLYSTRNHEQAISLELVEDPELSSQGYRLSITSRRIEIEGVSEQGVYYGIQTILSLLRSSWDKQTRTAALRQMVIIDEPLNNIRIAQVETDNDSLNVSVLIKKLGKLKINRLVLPANHSTNPNTELLEASYISLLTADGMKVTQFQNLEGDREQIREVFEKRNVTSTDTAWFRLVMSEDIELPLGFSAAAQLGWSGAGKKDFKWLTQHATTTSAKTPK